MYGWLSPDQKNKLIKGRYFFQLPSMLHVLNQTSLWTTTKILSCQSIIQVQQPQVKNIVAFFVLTSVEPQSFGHYPYGLNTLIQLVWQINTLKNRCWAIVPDNNSLCRVSKSSLKVMPMKLPLQNNCSHNLLRGAQQTALILCLSNPKKESELYTVYI